MKRPPRVVRSWNSLALVALAALFGVVSVVNIVRAGFDQPWWAWILIAAVVLALLGIATMRQQTRLRALRTKFPDGYVQLVALYALPVRQLLNAASTGIAEIRSLTPNTTAVVVLHGADLQLYGGVFFGTGGRPKLLVSLTLPADAEVKLESTAQGRYYLKSLCFVSSGSAFRLDLCVIRSYFGLLATVFRNKELDHQLELARAAWTGTRPTRSDELPPKARAAE